ncbi:protein prune homolog 2-like isoform X2 [Pollicipes pollicipes]|nr:protein prune homolog 2-like isoform X2 [Pollicipes pollicipes]
MARNQPTPVTLAADSDRASDSLESRPDHYDLQPGVDVGECREATEQDVWRTCMVAGKEQRIDMNAIEPYTKVLSQGGYVDGDAGQPIIVFACCHLPDRARADYTYIMDNLFLYVLATLDELVSDNYVLVYLHGATDSGRAPPFGWLRRCYQLIDRRLRKNLQCLYLVHPTFWLRTVVALTRPFVSSKFSRKLRYVSGLRELSDMIPMNHVVIPDKVKQLEFQLMIAERKRELRIK